MTESPTVSSRRNKTFRTRVDTSARYSKRIRSQVIEEQWNHMRKRTSLEENELEDSHVTAAITPEQAQKTLKEYQEGTGRYEYKEECHSHYEIKHWSAP